MALYKILLRSKELEFTVLGGRTRTSLAYQRQPVYVEKLLNEEEKAQRRAMTPTAKDLKARGVRVRWSGAVLEKEVRGPSGRSYWERVQLAREPRSPRGAGAAASAAAAGDEFAGLDADAY
jgi:hypothetical protein